MVERLEKVIAKLSMERALSHSPFSHRSASGLLKMELRRQEEAVEGVAVAGAEAWVFPLLSL
jgi:hypothetical protein